MKKITGSLTVLTVVLGWTTACRDAGPTPDEWVQLGPDGTQIGHVRVAETWVIATTPGAIYVREPATASWSNLWSLSEYRVLDVAVLPLPQRRLLVGVGRPHPDPVPEVLLFSSDDWGASWHPADGGLGAAAAAAGHRLAGRRIAFDPQDPRRVFLAGGGYWIMRSTDGAASWTVVHGDTSFGGGVPATDIFVSANSNRTVWVARNDDFGAGLLLRSRDGGDTWDRLRPFDRLHEIPIYSVHSSGDALEAVWIGHLGGISVSTDGGETWESELQESIAITSLIPFDGDLVATGLAVDVATAPCSEEGLCLFRYAVDEGTWRPIDGPAGVSGGASAAVDEQGRLVIATADGVWRLERR